MFSLSSESLFRLPSHEGEARQIYYGFMVGGVLSPPMILLVYHKFVASQMGFGIREFFLIFTVVYLLIFVVCSNIAKKTSFRLREKFDESLPRDAIVVAPVAARSKLSEVTLIGRRYWFWQLVCSYLSGVTFSWIGCIFALFVI